jgi:hypothetical protein
LIVGAIRESAGGDEMDCEVAADVPPSEAGRVSGFFAPSVVLEQPMARSRRPSNAEMKREFEMLFLTVIETSALLID